MNTKHLTMATVGAALAFTAFAATSAQAQGAQEIPALVYRTGPFAPNGVSIADGYSDYYTLINERDGGVNGVKFNVTECDTAYKTDRGVECYDRIAKGTTVVSPYSTGITYALIEKATADKVPILSMGYGRTSAADGRVFPYVFNFPATYWSQATSVIQHIANEEGGLAKLKGQNFAFIYLDHPYGREPRIEPTAFDVQRSFFVLFMIIVGGLGSILGSFLGAAFITLLPIFLNAAPAAVGLDLDTDVITHIEFMTFGALIVFFLIVEPRGLARLWEIAKEKLRLWPFPY